MQYNKENLKNRTRISGRSPRDIQNSHKNAVYLRSGNVSVYEGLIREINCLKDEVLRLSNSNNDLSLESNSDTISKMEMDSLINSHESIIDNYKLQVETLKESLKDKDSVIDSLKTIIKSKEYIIEALKGTGRLLDKEKCDENKVPSSKEDTPEIDKIYLDPDISESNLVESHIDIKSSSGSVDRVDMQNQVDKLRKIMKMS